METSTSPDIENFIESLEGNTIVKVIRTIELLKAFGHEIGMPHSKKITADMFELRIRGRQEVRIFYTFYKKSAYLLHGFIKKTRKIPPKELNTALIKLKLLTQYHI